MFPSCSDTFTVWTYFILMQIHDMIALFIHSTSFFLLFIPSWNFISKEIRGREERWDELKQRRQQGMKKVHLINCIIKAFVAALVFVLLRFQPFHLLSFHPLRLTWNAINLFSFLLFISLALSTSFLFLHTNYNKFQQRHSLSHVLSWKNFSFEPFHFLCPFFLFYDCHASLFSMIAAAAAFKLLRFMAVKLIKSLYFLVLFQVHSLEMRVLDPETELVMTTTMTEPRRDRRKEVSSPKQPPTSWELGYSNTSP